MAQLQGTYCKARGPQSIPIPNEECVVCRSSHMHTHKCNLLLDLWCVRKLFDKFILYCYDFGIINVIPTETR